MAGYIVYWPQEQVRKLQKAQDTGPIRVVLGSIHTKMPSIAKVKVGDVLYPVTLKEGMLYVMARLPVERTEAAFDYLLRETGYRQAALIPEGTAYEEMAWRGGKTTFRTAHAGSVDREALPASITRIELWADRQPIPHLCHQEPFNCCAQTAASGTKGSAIRPRPVPEEKLSELLFGPSRAKQRPLRRNAQGELTALSLSGAARKMSEATQAYFDTLFEGEGCL